MNEAHDEGAYEHGIEEDYETQGDLVMLSMI